MSDSKIYLRCRRVDINDDRCERRIFPPETDLCAECRAVWKRKGLPGLAPPDEDIFHHGIYRREAPPCTTAEVEDDEDTSFLSWENWELINAAFGAIWFDADVEVFWINNIMKLQTLSEDYDIPDSLRPRSKTFRQSLKNTHPDSSVVEKTLVGPHDHNVSSKEEDVRPFDRTLRSEAETRSINALQIASTHNIPEGRIPSINKTFVDLPFPTDHVLLPEKAYEPPRPRIGSLPTHVAHSEGLWLRSPPSVETVNTRLEQTEKMSGTREGGSDQKASLPENAETKPATAQTTSASV